MKDSEMQRCRLRAQMFKALAHPLRVLMLEKLNQKTWCVSKLADELGIEKSAASKHLSILKEAGIIADERQGTTVHYSLIAPCVLELAACAEGAVLMNRRHRLEAPAR